MSRLTYAQFISAGSRHATKTIDLTNMPNLRLDSITEVHRILSNSAVSLKDALELLPKSMHVNIQVLYPSAEEQRALRLGPTVNINSFADAILGVVFDHARTLREQSPESIRSIVFSSYNPIVCTALNWKQPNYNVFLCNDLGHEGGKAGVSNAVSSSGRRTTSIKEAVRTAQNNNFMGLICVSRLLVCHIVSWFI